jgi:hypothetical protein
MKKTQKAHMMRATFEFSNGSFIVFDCVGDWVTLHTKMHVIRLTLPEAVKVLEKLRRE